MSSLRRLGTLALVGLSLAGCTLGPNFVTPRSAVNPAWQMQASSLDSAKATEDRAWWRALGSPTLDGLVESAYRNNPNLQAAGVRVLQAQAQLNIAIGSQYPQQQAMSGSIDYKSRDPGLFDSDTELFLQRIGVGASWEPDFWGKYRRAIESNRAEVLANLAAYDNALVTLVADVANAFVGIRTLSDQIAVYASNAAAQADGLRIATVRFENGATSALDVSQATTRLAETVAKIPSLRQQWKQTANALSLLLGETPGYADKPLAESTDTPKAPPEIALGIPQDLLRRRPDVRQALETAAAQCATIGVAQSAMYPSFTLGGSFGYGSTNRGVSSADLFSWGNRFLELGGSFVFPIFNYGRLINQVRVQDAGFQQAVLNYQNTVLAAQEDVENSLAAFVYAQRTVLALEKADQAARRTTALAMDDYKEGETGFSALILAYNSQLQVEDALAQAKGSVLLGLVSVYRALGGGWQIREGQSLVAKPVVEAMRKRTDWGGMLSTGTVPAPVETPPPARKRAQTQGSQP